MAALEQLQSQADADLARRSLLGVWGYAVLIILLFSITSYGHDHPATALSGAGAIVLCTAWRIYLLKRKQRIYDRDPGRWRAWYSVAVLSSALSWGCLTAVAVVVYPLQSWTLL